MSAYRELIGASNVEAWRSYVQSLVVADPRPLNDRLDYYQRELTQRGWFVGNGHEAEFRLDPISERISIPPKADFYNHFIDEVGGGLFPPLASKGQIIDPRIAAGPILVDRRYHATGSWAHNGNVMEVSTSPSFDWRESYQRLWDVLGTLGRVAATYNCRAKILSTHLSTTVVKSDAHDELDLQANNAAPALFTAAVQNTRQQLEPLEPFTSQLYYRGETYPSKAVLWAVYPRRIETRYPGFAIVDTRLSMLGALAGVHSQLENTLPANDTVHSCETVSLFGSFPRLESLSSILAWDHALGKMVLPGVVTRSRLDAAMGPEGTRNLDWLVWVCSDKKVADCAQDNAAFLREAVRGIELTSDKKLRAIAGPFKGNWDILLHGCSATFSPAVRIALPPRKSDSFIEGRNKAAASPEVQEILGDELVQSLTPSDKAMALRQKRLATKGL